MRRARKEEEAVDLGRRAFGKLVLCAAAGALPGCRDPERYTEADTERLAVQRREEAERSGLGPYGPQHYRGYRGLAELPWFEVEGAGDLQRFGNLTEAEDFAVVYLTEAESLGDE